VSRLNVKREALSETRKHRDEVWGVRVGYK